MHPLTTGLFSQTTGGAPAGPAGLLGSPFLMIALMFVVFYFVLWRPQSKEKKRVEAFRQGLKRGDRVCTQGGIIGTVAAVEDTSIQLDIGGGNKLRILKSSVAGEWREKGEAPSEPSRLEKK